jgi:hypothetical protein
MGDADVENSAGIVEWKRQRILLFFLLEIIFPNFLARFWERCIDELFYQFTESLMVFRRIQNKLLI